MTSKTFVNSVEAEIKNGGLSLKKEKDKNVSEELLQAKCQTIYHNLLTSLTIKEVTPPIYLREWWQTERCDQFSNLSDVRRDVKEDVTPSSLERILAFQETIEDEARAAQTMTHYREWHRQRLWGSLTWSNKLYYWFYDTPHDTLAKIGLMSTPYGGYRAALRFYKNRVDMKRAAEEAARGYQNSKKTE